MEAYSIIIILLAVAIAFSPIARRTKVPYPVLMLLAGIAAGFMPGFHALTLNPEVVFLIFLPPMLYDAADHIHFRDFRSNMSTIATLAFALVFLTTGIIAIAVHYCTGMPWPLAFVVGAVLSPPDAIAATGITKELNLPHRTNIILEGESLINDASALVAFRFAVASVAGAAFVATKAATMFVIAIAGGLTVGYILAHIFISIARKMKDKDVVVSLNLILPFVAYLVAEEIHVSGVIAVVVAGLSIARHKERMPEKESTFSRTRSVMETVIFLLGGFVFIQIGMEFPRILGSIPPDRRIPLIAAAFLIFLVALLVRMLIIFMHKKNREQRLRHITQQIERFRRNPLLRTAHRSGHARSPDEYLRFLQEMQLSWKESILVGWSGMRGIVSLAAALSLPITMDDGSLFPQRDTILFLTVSVVILMLVIQGLGLPLLLRLLRMDRTKDARNPAE
jgi:CPA1 family monovalent cation:H+ antiporter